MGGGKERKETDARQAAIAQSQYQTGQDLTKAGTDTTAQGLSLFNPAIDFYSKLASGDSSKMVQAAAPIISNITKQYASTKQNIQDTVPAGAGRAFALASLGREQANANSGALNNAYMSAFPALANIGGQVSGVGLQQTGAGLRGTEGAAQTNNQLQQVQQQRKASQLGFFGSLAGAAAAPFTGGMSGIFKAGGGSGFSMPGSNFGGFAPAGVSLPSSTLSFPGYK